MITDNLITISSKDGGKSHKYRTGCAAKLYVPEFAERQTIPATDGGKALDNGDLLKANLQAKELTRT